MDAAFFCMYRTRTRIRQRSEDANERGRIAGEEAEELRAERVKRREVRDLREVRGGDQLLFDYADLHLELLLVLEEFFKDLRDACGVFAAS